MVSQKKPLLKSIFKKPGIKVNLEVVRTGCVIISLAIQIGIFLHLVGFL